MKLLQKIFDEETLETKDVILDYDHQIIKGLYLSTAISKVKSNAKKLDIKFNIARNKEEFGLKFIKINDFVAIPLTMLDDSNYPHKLIFIVTKECNSVDLFTTQNPALEGMESIFMQAIEMNRIDNLNDLINWRKQNEFYDLN